MTFGSLFSGIGGFDLGLERAGLECRWQVEVDPYCRKVLERHWPRVPRHEDVRHVGKGSLERVDVIAGGFPCQDTSIQGKGEGLDGARSGLWWEMLRVVRELMPLWVLIENPMGAAKRWVPSVRCSLYRAGYSSVCLRVRGLDVGSPQLRARGFVIATTHPYRLLLQRERWGTPRWEGPSYPVAELEGGRRAAPGPRTPSGDGQWSHEPGVGRVAYGVPQGVLRIRALGNAVIPQVAEYLGNRIPAMHEAWWARRKEVRSEAVEGVDEVVDLAGGLPGGHRHPDDGTGRH